MEPARRFFTVFTCACHFSLSWATLVHPLFILLLLSSTARSSNWCLSLWTLTKTLYATVLCPILAACPVRIMLREEYKLWSRFMQFHPVPCHLIPLRLPSAASQQFHPFSSRSSFLGPNIFLSTPLSDTFSITLSWFLCASASTNLVAI